MRPSLVPSITLVLTLAAAGASRVEDLRKTMSGQTTGQPQPSSGPLAGPSVDPPAEWLSPTGKSESWTEATRRCRELLGRLDLRSPLVRQHLPAVKRKAEMLLRTPSFDWKQKTAVDYLENMLADLIAGREPSLRYAGSGLGFPYWSDAMQRIEAIWVHVPPGYGPAKSYQLLMYYKCGGGIHLKDGGVAGGYRPTAEMANRTDTFHAWSSLSTQVKGRMGAEIELAEATAALAADFSVDPDRVFLTGWSDGGFTAVWLAAHYPHLVAGIAPNCANWQYTNVVVPGLSNVPTLAVDGWGDGGYNRSQFVRWQMLRGLGADASAVWGQHGHSYLPYEDPEEFQYILDWAGSKRRDLHPRRVRYATWNLAWPRAYWVSIRRMQQPWLPCRIDVEVQGNNRIEVQTWNVAAYELRLSDKLVDPARRVIVTTNGEVSYSDVFREELAVELAPPPPGKYVKSASLPDGIAAQTVGSSYGPDGYLSIPGRTWLAVRPTGLSPQESASLAGWYPEGAKADTEVSQADLAEQNLFLYGGPAVNRLTARIAADLPVRFEPGRFVVGKRVYDQPTHCVALLHPNPLNPKKYVILYAYNDASVFARGGFFEMTGEQPWAFRTGDCVVRGIPSARTKWGVAVSAEPFHQRHLVLDGAWQVPRLEPLAELAEPFDYVQILRLQADALREATGAEIGIIAEHTPRYVRWSERLPAGPVTLDDLATLDALPQYVSVGRVAGKDLVGPHGFQPAAWTVRADRREKGTGPGELAVEDLDPQKTYRVAVGYYGIPAYRAEPARMPPLVKFATPGDFLANPHNGILVADLEMTPLTVTEAVARHLAKRGRVAPRHVGYDLTDYVLNPQANDFGACDWLHVGIDVAWRGPYGKPEPGRYTVNLGFRKADEPALAHPRPSSKQFADFDLDGREPAAWDLARLDKRLPLRVTVKADSRAILVDPEHESFALGPADAPGRQVGRATVVTFRLANEGDNDLAAELILADTVLRKVNGEVWPAPDGAPPGSYYAGYHRALGKWKEPPVHEDAVLLLFADKVPKLDKLVAPGAGYNFGLAGLRQPLAIERRQAKSLSLLLISVDRPAQGPPVALETVLEALRESLRPTPAPSP